MAFKKSVVVATATTTVVNNNSVVDTKTITSKELTNKSKVKVKERLVTSIRKMIDRSAPNSLKKPPLLQKLRLRSSQSDKLVF